MSAITYITGDATRPVGEGRKIIAHCCNDLGLWGAGFVLALSKRWHEPEMRYRSWARIVRPLPLGHVQYVPVEDDTVVANIIGQEGIHPRQGLPPIRYPALAEAFVSIAKNAERDRASIHMPLIGCGLAGGRWEIVEELILTAFNTDLTPVYVYRLP